MNRMPQSAGNGDPATQHPGQDPQGPVGGASASPSEPGSSEGGGPQDFGSLIRSNPERAEQVYRQKQSEADRAAAEVQRLRETQEKLGRIPQLVDAIGADNLETYLGHYAQLRSHPTTSPIIQQLEQTGQIPAKMGGAGDYDDGEDEYETPEAKQIRELQQKLTTMEQRLHGVHSSQGVERFKAHVQSVFEEFGPDLDDELKAMIDKGVEDDLRRLSADQVASFDRNAVQTLILRHLGFDGMMSMAERKLLRKQQDKAAASTGVPSGIGTSPTPPSTGYANRDNVKETLREAYREAAQLYGRVGAQSVE